jgi:hypothetical protein
MFAAAIFPFYRCDTNDMSCNMLCCATLRKLESCAPTGEGNNQLSNAMEESAEVQALLTRIALISNEEGDVSMEIVQ